MELDGLVLEVDGMTRTFGDWTRDFVKSYYPNIGVDCYRVPALHFDQQILRTSKYSECGLEKLKLLHPQMLCVSVGDLVHSLVLDSLEKLSHQLKLRNEGPLFIISSVKFENYLAKLQQQSRRRKRRGRKEKDPEGGNGSTQTPFRSAKLRRTSAAGDEIPAESGNGRGAEDKEEEGEDEDEERKLPPMPSDLGKNSRGEIDVLLLHERRGAILVEVKATGYSNPKWTPSEEELQSVIGTIIQKARRQLDRARDMLRYVMPDLSLTRVTLVIALPYLSREQVTKAACGQSLDPSLRFLCKEDLLSSASQDPIPASQASPPAAAAAADSSGCPDQHDGLNVPGLLAWWRSSVAPAAAEGLTVDSIRTIVGRICGLMSVVSVWTNSRPRMEVRTLSQALGEAGRRVSDIVLLPSQADLLAQQTLLRVWLTGPMGSGKTLMLQLKGRQWVREGRRVVVINVRTTARGRPIGHVLEVGIRQAGEGHPGAGSVDRCDIALDEYSIDVLHKQLADRGPMDKLGFVVDEILSDMSVIAEELALHYPASPVWCVASYVTPVPDTFKVYRLGVVLRNQPSVQLMLKEMDPNPMHEKAYTTRNVAGSFPCDGPPVIFIEHSKHNTGVRHLDCSQCANELADIFETKLGLQLRPPAAFSESSASGSTPKTPDVKRSRNTTSAAPLSFSDVLILSAVPSSIYKHIKGYHWEPSIEELRDYIIFAGKGRFLSRLRERGVPFKIALDNTMKEIVFPPKDEVIFIDLMGAHSLERKVVVFLRGGGPLTQAEVSEHMSRYRAVQAASRSAAHQPAPDKPDCAPGKNSSPQKELNTGQEGRMLSDEMRLFASMMYELRDMVYPQLPESVLETPMDAISTLLGNMMVVRIHSFVKGKAHEETCQRQAAEPPETLSTDMRVGSEIRAYLPASPKTESQTAPGSSSSGKQSQSSRKSVVEADSVFLVPHLQGDAVKRESEMRRVRRALGVMSEDDKDWEFLAASRCLSVYISILP